MAEKRAYDSLVTAMDRKAREYWKKSNSLGRTAKSKHDKLLGDVTELKRLGELYVVILSESDSTDEKVIEEIYENQIELLEKVNHALEGAEEFIENEEFISFLLSNLRTTYSC